MHHLLLARIQACNFSSCLPSFTLLESNSKFLAEPKWILSAKPQARTLEVSFFEIQASFYSLPEELNNVFAVFTSLTRNTNIDFILQRNTNFIILPIVTYQNAK